MKMEYIDNFFYIDITNENINLVKKFLNINTFKNSSYNNLLDFYTRLLIETFTNSIVAGVTINNQVTITDRFFLSDVEDLKEIYLECELKPYKHLVSDVDKIKYIILYKNKWLVINTITNNKINWDIVRNYKNFNRIKKINNII